MKCRALVGINYGPKEIRVEAGEVHVFPLKVAKHLIAQGWVEAVQE